MTNFTAIIVDDELHARKALNGLLKENFPQVEVLAQAQNIPEAIKLIALHSPDIVFLDIQMPGYLGTEILDFFSPDQIKFHIIFVTAYNEYALKAFELSAIDYLLKPTRPEYVKRALDKIKTKIGTSEDKFSQALDALKANLTLGKINKIAFQVADGVIAVPLEDIIFLKADSSYTHIHFRNGSKITVSKTLHEYNSLEDTGLFNRVNRSYIINLKCIEKISKKDGGFVKMITGEEISATVEKRNALLKIFDNFLY